MGRSGSKMKRKKENEETDTSEEKEEISIDEVGQINTTGMHKKFPMFQNYLTNKHQNY